MRTSLRTGVAIMVMKRPRSTSAPAPSGTRSATPSPSAARPWMKLQSASEPKAIAKTFAWCVFASRAICLARGLLARVGRHRAQPVPRRARVAAEECEVQPVVGAQLRYHLLGRVLQLQELEAAHGAGDVERHHEVDGHVRVARGRRA